MNLHKCWLRNISFNKVQSKKHEFQENRMQKNIEFQYIAFAKHHIQTDFNDKPLILIDCNKNYELR